MGGRIYFARLCESMHLGVYAFVRVFVHLIIWVAPFEILELKEGGAAKGMLRNAQLKEGGATRRHGKAIILLLYILVTFINY